MSRWRQQSLAERLEEKIDKSGGPDACWVWTAGCNKYGYGVIKLGSVGSKVKLVHRLCWEEAHGPVPIDLEVCHSCDNRRCCNVAHLWLGTHKQNIADMCAKGRKNPYFKIAKAGVIDIRARYANGESIAVIARDFPAVKSHTVYCIATKRRQKHVA